MSTGRWQMVVSSWQFDFLSTSPTTYHLPPTKPPEANRG